MRDRSTFQSEISNSSWLSSTQRVIAALHLSRAAFPYFTPLTAQFALPCDVGTIRSIKIFRKPSHF